MRDVLTNRARAFGCVMEDVVNGVTAFCRESIVGTNTGNGVATFANPATSQAAIDGDYILSCTAAATNAGTFSVQTPDGREIGPLTVGAAFNKEIKLTIADGSSDFTVGDSFVVRVGLAYPGGYLFAAKSGCDRRHAESGWHFHLSRRHHAGIYGQKPDRRSQRLGCGQKPDLARRHNCGSAGGSDGAAAKAWDHNSIAICFVAGAGAVCQREQRT